MFFYCPFIAGDCESIFEHFICRFPHKSVGQAESLETRYVEHGKGPNFDKFPGQVFP